jgi:hypothetical protein
VNDELRQIVHSLSQTVKQRLRQWGVYSLTFVNNERTLLGTDRAAPAPLRETVTTEDWEITVLEVVRGEDAWVMVQEANQFNEPAAEGMEYVAVKVYARYISVVDKMVSINGSYFRTTGGAGVLHELPSVVESDPVLDARLSPGGKIEGWVVVQAEQGEVGLMAVFEPL